jgi:ElaA protein
LRSAVFVVEQTCPFLDIDGVDPACWHSARLSRRASRRLLPPRPAGREVPRAFHRPRDQREGRAPHGRRTRAHEGSGRARHELWPGERLRIGAQMYLKAFYEGFGFAQSSEPYDEDGILHIEMIREAK